MEGILEMRGFLKDTYINEWTKDNWTARIKGQKIEIFNSVDKEEVGIYHHIDLKRHSILELINIIDNLI